MTLHKGLVIGLVMMVVAAAAIFGSGWRAVGQSAPIKTAKAADTESAAPAPSLNVERLSATAKPAAEATTATATTATAAASMFASAALRNVELQDSFGWAFG